MDKIFNKILDTKKDSLDNVIRGLKQFENNSVLNITLVQNSVPIDLTECTVRFNFLKPDKEVLLYMGDIINPEEGKIQLKLSTQLLNEIGNIKCDVSVFDNLMMKITSTNCVLIVEESIYSNDYYLNRDDFDIVQNMHIEEKKRLENENVRKSNEAKRIKNENTRIKDEDIRKGNESIRNKDEDVRKNNESTRINNESDRNTSEVIRNKNEDKRINNENERTKDENNRNISEQNRLNKETERKGNENTRINNESDRNASEVIRNKNEEIRIENETERTKDEDVRKSNEDKRIAKETERATNEEARIDNEDERKNKEIERVKNESTRSKKWKTIEETFKENAPGDMKKITYDTNNSGVVDKAETVPWEGIEGKPESIVTSVNGQTGKVGLTARDIPGLNNFNVEQILLYMQEQLVILGKKQGNLSTLKTSNKNNVVGALNELFTNANNGKTKIADVVGSPLLATDSFKQQKDKIERLKNSFANNLSGKGQSSSSTENLGNLINKVKNISTGKKFAKGTVTANVYGHFSVNNLSFTPKNIIFYAMRKNGNSFFTYGYSDDIPISDCNGEHFQHQKYLMGYYYKPKHRYDGGDIKKIYIPNEGGSFCFGTNDDGNTLRDSTINWIAIS